MLTIDVNAFPFPIQPDISIDLQICLYKGGLSALKERSEKREGEDGLARDWYMVGRGGVAGKGGNLAQHNIQDKNEEKIIILNNIFETNVRGAIQIKGCALAP